MGTPYILEPMNWSLNIGYSLCDIPDIIKLVAEFEPSVAYGMLEKRLWTNSNIAPKTKINISWSCVYIYIYIYMCVCVCT